MSFKSEQIAIYKAAHKRLMGKPSRAAPERPDNRPEWTTPKVTPVYVPSQAKMSWPTLRRILAEVAQKHGLFVEEVLCPTKKRFVVLARFEFMYRATAETNASTVQIARFIGVDHTTVLHGIARHCAHNKLPSPRTSLFKVRDRNAPPRNIRRAKKKMAVALVRCRVHTKGVELHHWAPISVFGEDSDSWPTSWLCRDCHAEWHKRMESA